MTFQPRLKFANTDKSSRKWMHQNLEQMIHRTNTCLAKGQITFK